ncbi:MAG: ARMT1-like domain-containing protein [Proteobacteria bacterium]|nr:ARMT1-like domain-containing protein [Pseudomonadota bacterium]
MKLNPLCIPCFYKQADIIANLLKSDEKKKLELFKGLSKIIYETLNPDLTPAKMASSVHYYIKNFYGVEDPFKQLKVDSNKKINQFYNDFKRLVVESKDEIGTLAKLAIIGNLIDYSLFENINLNNIKEEIEKFSPAIYQIDDFKKDLEKSERILYITDNSGEIVFDKVFIEYLVSRRKKVIVVVKEEPILNDATMEDVKMLGIDRLTKVISIGNGEVGTTYPTKNEFLNKAMKTADIIISKGQANFETLYGSKLSIYYLFVVKCKAVADFLKVPEKSPVLIKEKQR